MIVDFTVSNFRSIKDPQTFSLHAPIPGAHLEENICYPAGDKIGVLKSAGLYGANASGKSNLLSAFAALQVLVKNSGDLKEGDAIAYYQPYLLAEASKSSPVRFELEFFVPDLQNAAAKMLRYRYCVAFNAQKIVEESLFFYPLGQQALIFNRGEDDTWQTITFGSLYKGGKKRLAFFANNAYLSKAGDSADSPPMIRDVYRYFRFGLGIISANQQLPNMNSFFGAKSLAKVSALLSLVDTGIANITVQQDDKAFPEFIDSLSENTKREDIEKYPDSIKKAILQALNAKPLFAHLTESGSSELFELEDESAGSQKLFNLAPLIIMTLSIGGVLVMDELDNSMHPFMAELIIKLFNDPRVNKGNAQLIFSTHNINLMTSELLRRDQIWFTEKQAGATRFYSLDDFDKKKVKPLSPFNQWYAEGRFGAVPAINYQGIVALFNESGASHAQET